MGIGSGVKCGAGGKGVCKGGQEGGCVDDDVGFLRLGGRRKEERGGGVGVLDDGNLTKKKKEKKEEEPGGRVG